MRSYYVLGMQIVGEGEGGTKDYGAWGGIVSSVFDAGKGIYSMTQADKKAKDDKAASDKAAESAITADRRATSAEVAASMAEATAAASKVPGDVQRAQIARAAATSAVQLSMQAGVGLPLDAQKRRVDAANEDAAKAADGALAAASANDGSTQKQTMMAQAAMRAAAAQATAARAASGQVAALAQPTGGGLPAKVPAPSGQGVGAWLTEDFHGLPKYGWGVLGGAVVGGIYWWKGRR